MPLPVIADTARVTFNWVNHSDSRTAKNVMHFKRTTGAPGLPGLAAAIDTALAGAGLMAAPVSSAWEVDSLDLVALYNQAIGLHHDLTNVLVGQASGDWVPQVAAVIKMTTALRGRSYRGRIFLPGLAESKIDSNGIADGTVTDTTGAWDTFANDIIAGGDWGLVVASYKHRTSEPVTNIACEKVTGTQRRRNRRR